MSDLENGVEHGDVSISVMINDEFVGELHVAAFMGVYGFWVLLEAQAEERGDLPERLKEDAVGMLRVLARFVAERRPEGPKSPHEKEAFAYCGLRFGVSKEEAK